ncbi:phenazine biosynthesis protein PhzF family [Haladaptatus litoreus]|uniref:Phenazine biosynthesis protein PhzF family n=1 Tax=Haladaptatus litoreus TaxID=553468 RepID=A0A1N6VG50_9EURY|nr:PhzF family phenazine biosynthesis protein [Haladaptatus litoreus]SIQ76853.1 phenazine biosynthesis protein PhzF family [Haladaptatus litoreus]
MQTVRTLLVDAFTDEPLAGNAAGVVPNADDLTDDQMQAIARELSVSETAFFSESEEADRRVRFFTPSTEIDLCGHATIASHVHLLEDGELSPGTHTLETEVGVLDIEVEENHTVWMSQNEPEIEPVELEYDRVGTALGIDPAALQDVGADIPMAVSSTGLPYLVIPVNFLEHLGGAEPDIATVEQLCEEVGAVGIYAFSFDAIDAESTLHGRMFAPLAGIPEDPVTGTASGAVGAFLRETDAFDEFPEELRLEQGHFLDRPGYVRVRATEDSVRVGGRATTALDGQLVVPESEDDGIIEC